MYKRNLRLPEKPKQSFFLWGTRQTGKTTLLKACYPDALRIDLLKTDEGIHIVPYQEFTKLLWDGKWTQDLLQN